VKTLLKKALIHAYCRGWIKPITVIKAFNVFGLKGH
jgi:hypothetical protein